MKPVTINGLVFTDQGENISVGLPKSGQGGFLATKLFLRKILEIGQDENLRSELLKFLARDEASESGGGWNLD